MHKWCVTSFSVQVCEEIFTPYELGYVSCLHTLTGAVPVNISSQFGPATDPILLDDICCNGTESTLLECIHLPIGDHKCGPENLAGVKCEGQWNEQLAS